MDTLSDEALKRIKHYLATHKALDDPVGYYNICAFEKVRYTAPIVFKVICEQFKWCDEEILDVGCATGFSLKRLFAERKVGVDISSVYCKMARRYLDEVHCCRAESLPFKDQEFKTVVAGELLEHTNWRLAIPEICRVTRCFLAITRSDDNEEMRLYPERSAAIRMQHDMTLTCERIIMEVLEQGFLLRDRIVFGEFDTLLLFEREVIKK